MTATETRPRTASVAEFRRLASALEGVRARLAGDDPGRSDAELRAAVAEELSLVESITSLVYEATGVTRPEPAAVEAGGWFFSVTPNPDYDPAPDGYVPLVLAVVPAASVRRL